jgi:hypothetical protein
MLTIDTRVDLLLTRPAAPANVPALVNRRKSTRDLATTAGKIAALLKACCSFSYASTMAVAADAQRQVGGPHRETSENIV